MTIQPSNYPTTKPALTLDFANSKQLDPRITFSRSSSGTYVDANGVIQSAATNVARFDHNPATGESLGLLVEEARTNSFTYSHYLDDATWTKTNTQVIPNALLAPDNTFTGRLLNSQAAGSANVNRAFTRSNPAFTVFIKAGSSSTANLKIQSDVVGRNVSYNVNLSTGVLTAGTGNTGNITGWTEYTSITAMSNGWYRVFIGFSSSTGTVNSTYSVSPCANGSAAAANESIYVWGAQLEAGAFPTSYIPTPATFTSRASTATYYDASGVIQTAGSNVARSAAFFPDSNGVMRSAGLLLEAAGTNLVTYSEQLDNAAWRKTASTITANAAAAPDGTTTADLLYPSSTGTLRYMDANVTISSSITTISFFVKSSGFTRCYLLGGTTSIAAWFDLSAGTVGTVTSGCSASIQKLASGWFRCSLTQPATTAPYASIGPCDADNSFTATASGTNGILVWGAQLEASPYPTSYIPTTTATVTRAADVSSSATVTRSADVAQMTGTNFSSWYRQDEGTLSFSTLSKGNAFAGYLQGASTINRIDPYQSNSFPTLVVVNNGTTLVNSASSTAMSFASTQQFAIGIKQGAYALAQQGAVTITGTNSASPPTITQMFLGRQWSPLYLNGTISRLSYWPTRLSDATLQAITR